ncbi:MAG: hypothetical protein ACE37F_19110 [Nannocystaceae bacterium]|nr:autophagy-related protein 17 [bacterium]
MSPSDITVELLKQIRDGVYETHERIDQTNARLDQTNKRLDQTRVELLEKLEETRSHLSERIDQTNGRIGRLETSVSTLIGAVSSLADRDNRFETDLAGLRQRVDVLEAHTD